MERLTVELVGGGGGGAAGFNAYCFVELVGFLGGLGLGLGLGVRVRGGSHYGLLKEYTNSLRNVPIFQLTHT